MADRPTFSAQPLSRDEITTFANTPRQVKFFENLGKDIQENIPDAFENIGQDAGTVLATDSFRHREPIPSPLLNDGENANQVLALGSFQRQSPPLTFTAAEDDSARILANQIFGG